jgi:two-component system LytT family response regulator
MEEMSGFELLKQMESIPFEIIFVTAYEEYAIQALKANALDYLLKPVDKDDLITAIERLKARIEKKNSSNHLQNIIGQITYPASKKIAVSTFKSFEILDPEEILYCESESNYTRINLLNGKSILISKTLRIVEELLPVHMFIRINYSTVINVLRVKSFVREEGGYVVLDNGKTINVTKSRKDELMKRFNKI